MGSQGWSVLGSLSLLQKKGTHQSANSLGKGVTNSPAVEGLGFFFFLPKRLISQLSSENEARLMHCTSIKWTHSLSPELSQASSPRLIGPELLPRVAKSWEHLALGSQVRGDTKGGLRGGGGASGAFVPSLILRPRISLDRPKPNHINGSVSPWT